MRYGSEEWKYAEPVASALAENPEFLVWFLSRTRFAPHAQRAALLHREMKAMRSASSETWWRSHYTEKCRCEGCSGQETDMLAVFSAAPNRFALHIEVKQPMDKFPSHRDQARNYQLRAACWVRTPPRAVLPHSDAETVLLFSESRRAEYSDHIQKFGSSITSEEMEKHWKPLINLGFPSAA